jgi:WD40 repeat protein
VAFSPDSNWLAWGGEGQRIFFYDLVKDTLVDKFTEPYVPVRLAFSPDGVFLASLTTNGVNIRELDGLLVRTAGGAGLEDMAFWLDGSQFALAGNDVARVIDTGTGRDLAVLDFLEDDSPTAVAYSPDGAFLAVGWTSGRIELYWAGTKEKLITFEGHQGAVRRIAFTAGSRLMLSSGQDGTVRVWGAVP